MKCGDKIISEDFVSLMKESLNEKDASLLFSWLESGEDVVSVRLNPFKSFFSPDGSLNEFASKLFGDNLDSPVEWCKSGFYLKKRISFTADPFFHCGAYYVQDASSMFLEIIRKFFVLDGNAGGDCKISNLKV